MSVWDEIWGKKFPQRPFAPVGFSKLNKTGEWRSQKPVREAPLKCVKCDLCWIYCPDGAIKRPVTHLDDYTIDYEYCKGCGICAEECPAKVIKMLPEH